MMDSNMLRHLLEIARHMSETRALEPLLTYIVDASIAILGAEYGYVVLAQSDGMLQFMVQRDENGNDIESPENQISRTILYRALNDGQALITASAMHDPEYHDRTSVRQLRLRSVMCVPMTAQSEAIGVLYLENRSEEHTFAEADIEPLEFIANHAAVCIENARLNRELEHRVEKRSEQLRAASHQYAIDAADAGANATELRLIVEQERIRILSNFFQDASHQFRTPLSIINANVDILRRKINDDQYDGHMDKIRDQVKTITQLVDSLNMLVRLDSATQIDMQEIDLNRVCRELHEVFAVRANKQQLQMTLNLAPQPVPFTGSLEYMRIAIQQVLENALRFTSARDKIMVSVEADNTHPCIVIADTGTGIASDDLPHVTTRFYRGDTAGTTRGLGLGLSIAAKIMSLHDGKIEIASVLGEGTTVKLIFKQ